MRLLYFLFAALAAAQSPAPPAITAVENNYSYIRPGAPNYGIAQGSIFAIFGSNFSSSSSGLQSLPLSTTLAGVSVQISVDGTTTQALLYYLMPNQIGGILPSATPVGNGEIVVTNNGNASAAAPINVVQSAFGIVATGNPLAGSTAAVYDAKWNPLSTTNAANPGDIVVFYGTGVGPVTGNEAATQTPQNLSNIPIEVDIGGIPASVQYHGRSTYPGLDQINVVVPQGVSGCNVSLAVVTSGIVSNIAFLPVAGEGRTCSDQVPGVNYPAELSLTGKLTYSYGVISTGRTVEVAPAIPTGSYTIPARNVTIDDATATFQRVSNLVPAGLTVSTANYPFPSLGNCLAQSFLAPPFASSQSASAPASATPSSVNLDAGPALNFTIGSAKASIMFSQGQYGGALGGAANLPLFFPSGGGTLTIDNGSGGADIGAFTVQANVPSLLTWSNISLLPATINRSSPLTLTWTGGDPSAVLDISATASTNTALGILQTTVSCLTPVSAGQFTVPASALLSLPPTALALSGNPPELPTTQLSMTTQDVSQFSGPGLDGGLISIRSTGFLTVPFQ